MSARSTIGTAVLLKDFYGGESDEIEWLRKLRNKYIHLNLDKPFLEMNAWFNNQDQLEDDATKVIKIVIKAFLQSPGT